MADLKKTIQIIFSGDDKVSNTIKGVSSGLGSLESSVMSVAEPLAGLADNILKADAALATLTGITLAYGFAKFKEFENATANLKKILGDEADQIDVVEAAVLDLSNAYGIAATGVMVAATDFRRAGFNVNESVGLAQDAINLVIAASEAEFDVANASEAIIATLKGFKAEASESGRLVDILNKVSNEYATNVTELAVGMAELSPVARLMGFSFEETAGVLTPVVEIYRSGTEAATALRTGLLKIIDDAAPVTTALENLGVAQKNSNGGLRSGRDILFDIADAFTRVDEDQKLMFATQLVGIRQASKMVEIFDNMSYAMGVTEVALNAGGSALYEVGEKAKTAQVKWDRFLAGVENFGIVLGDSFKEGSKEALDGGTALVNQLQHMITAGDFAPVLDVLSDFGREFGALLEEIAAIAPEALEAVDWDPLLESFAEFGDEIRDFFEDLDLTNPEDLARGMQFAVDSIASLINTTAGMVNTFQPILEGILATVEGFNDLDADSQKAAGGVLAGAKAIVDAGLLMSGVLVMIGGHAEEITRVFNYVIGDIKGLWNSLQAAFDLVAEGFIDTLGLFIEGTEALNNALGLGGLNQGLQDWKTSLLDIKAAISTDRVAQWEEAIDGYSQAWKGLAGDVDDVADKIDGIPGEKKIAVKIAEPEDFDSAMNKIVAAYDQIPAEKETRVKPSIDPSSIITAKAKLKTELPDNKLMRIQADVDIAKLRAATDLVKDNLEWKAKLDIADVEAAAQILEANFDAIGTQASAVGDAVSSLSSALGEVSGGHFYEVFHLLEDEMALQRENFEEQKKLTAAQTEYLNLKNERAKTNPEDFALIKVSGDGLEPELEAFMWKILGRIQVRATEESAEFLLGL